MRIVIGTRGSELALKQTEIVRKKLMEADPSLAIELKVIKTEGDRNQSPIPLDTVGKGWFTKEIEDALLKGSIDLAVHSLKDLPEELPAGLRIGAYPGREDARDVLVSNGNVSLKYLKPDARVGTDSSRRRVQILALRPDVRVESMRGNVPTRIAKLETDGYDAAVLAAAGILRLGLDHRIAQFFDIDQVTPAPGQGILAVEIRSSKAPADETIAALVDKINDRKAETAANIERTFSKRVGGGCKEPVGAYAEITRDSFTLHGMIAPEDGKRLVRDMTSGKTVDAIRLAQQLGDDLLGLFKDEGR